MKLHLHVKTCYFEQIKAGTKTEEYRLVTPYWQKRLIRTEYDSIVIYNAYKPGEENRIVKPWRGWIARKITHPHFGENPVTVFAIRLEG